MKVFSDINAQCDNVIEARRPDIILIDKKEQKGIINYTILSIILRKVLEM